MTADNDFGPELSGRRPRIDQNSHGQAALLLAESLMHILVANGTISREEFIDVVEGAADVERELAHANAMTPEDRDGSLLNPLANAFRQELGR